MIKACIRCFLAFSIVFFSAAITTVTANAEWETGINVVTVAAAEIEETQDYTTPEEFSAEVLRLVNDERANKNLSSFSCLEVLSKPADIRAKESATLFAHKRPSGSSCSTVYSDCGLTYRAAGENLAYGFSTPDDFVKAWMASKSHRQNILSKNFVNAEVGFYKNTDGVIYCSLLLYSPI